MIGQLTLVFPRFHCCALNGRPRNAAVKVELANDRPARRSAWPYSRTFIAVCSQLTPFVFSTFHCYDCQRYSREGGTPHWLTFARSPSST